MDESEVVKNECSTKDGVMQVKELKEAASIPKLSDSINKLFGKCSGSGNGSPNTSRVKEVARKANRCQQNEPKRSLYLILKNRPHHQKNLKYTTVLLLLRLYACQVIQ